MKHIIKVREETSDIVIKILAGIDNHRIEYIAIHKYIKRKENSEDHGQTITKIDIKIESESVGGVIALEDWQ